MYLKFKCPSCNQLSVEPSFERTLIEYKKEYSQDFKTLMPYSEAPLSPDYLVVSCCTSNCEFTEKLTLEEVVDKVRDQWSNAAWIQTRKDLGTPENFESYFEKYIFKKGLHKNINEEDKKRNPYINRLINHAEKKRSEDSNN
jgi:hypothetical protein